MSQPRAIALEQTFRYKFNTFQFSTGAPFTLAGTPSMRHYEDDNETQITAGLTLTVDYDSVTGLHEVECAATAANGYEAAKHYTSHINAGTVDSISAVGVQVYDFQIQSAAEAAEAVYLAETYLTHLVTTTTGNTSGATNRINLADFLDAQTVDEDMLGSAWTLIRAATKQRQDVVLVSVQSARLFNVVSKGDGGALDNTVAGGDFIWFTGWDSVRATVPGRTLDVTSGIASADVKKIAAVTVQGAGTSGDKWRAA